MSVSDGEDADAVNFNASFISREVDSSTVGKLDLNESSSTVVTDVQSVINTNITDISNRVVSPAVHVDNILLKTDGVNTKISQITGLVVDDSNNITGVNDLTVGNDLVVTGDLTVNGATTTVNTATLDVEDANITVNNGGNDASSEGAGITVERTGTDGKFLYEDALTSKFKLGAAAAEAEIATISHTQTLTNKTLGDTNTINAQDDAFTIDGNADATKQVDFDNSGATTSTKTTIATVQSVNRTITLPNADDTLIGKDTTDTLQNKNLTDTNCVIVDDADTSKRHTWSLGGATTSTDTQFSFSQSVTRSVLVPDADFTMVRGGVSDSIKAAFTPAGTWTGTDTGIDTGVNGNWKRTNDLVSFVIQMDHDPNGSTGNFAITLTGLPVAADNSAVAMGQMENGVSDMTAVIAGTTNTIFFFTIGSSTRANPTNVNGRISLSGSYFV